MNNYRRPENSAPGNDNSLELQRAHAAGYMRIHRFLYSVIDDAGACDESFARLALLGESAELVNRAIRTEARNWSRMRSALAKDPDYSQGYDFYYHYDVIGDWTTARIETWLQQIATDIGHLARLDDDAILKLGVSPDAACRRCARGRHCDLLDVAEFSSPDDNDTNTIAREEFACEQLRQHLTICNFNEGQDYITGTETISLRNADDSHINVEAPYMLLTLRAVRGLLTL